MNKRLAGDCRPLLFYRGCGVYGEYGRYGEELFQTRVTVEMEALQVW